MENNSKIIGIDASRIRSGGAVAHLLGLLNGACPLDFNIASVHIWCNSQLKKKLPKKPWLTVHSPTLLDKGLFFQILWQRIYLKKELQQCNCALLLNLDAATFCSVTPCVTISQDMLSYEPGILERYPLSLAKLRLLGILYLQNRALRRSSGVIFLTEYAANVIQLKCGRLEEIIIIPHGVDKKFYSRPQISPNKIEGITRCIYVSNADIYKNQLSVIEAMKILRSRGIDIRLTLVGGGTGSVQKKINDMLTLEAEEHSFLKQYAFLPSDELPALIQASDIYIFASSCENMPITLLEGMASKIPIACSQSGPMPEVIQDAAVFFDPCNPSSIARAIEKLIQNPSYARTLANNAFELSKRYNWETTSSLTWRYLEKRMN